MLTVDGNVFLGTGGAGQSGAAPAAQPSPLISVLGTIQSNVGVVDLQAGTDGVITVGANGLVNAATAATLTATAMNVAGTIVAPNATLVATTGTLGLTGTINATSNATLNGSAGINAAAGRVIGGGGLLAISQFGAVNLSNANNAVFASVGLAATSFTLNNAADLLLGDITAGTTATITAPSILVTGTVTAPNVVLTANTGTLGISGVVDASTAVALTGQTGIVGNAATVIGGGALSANSAAGAVDLTGTITVASASGGADTDFRLTNTGALDLGNVTAGGSVVVAAPTLAVSGIVDANVADLTASVGTLTLTGTVDASASAFLTGQGGIAGSTGRVIGNGTLSATSGGGAIDLSNANNAVSNATFDAFGAVSLVDTGALTLGGARAGSAAVVTAETLAATGLINAPTVSLTASTGALTLTGTIDASSAVTLSGKTGIAGNAGTIIGGATLSAVSATGAVELTNAGNAIAAASGSAAGAFRLVDTGGLNLGNVAAGSTVAVSAETLLVAGLVTAPTVSLTASAGALTLTGTVDASAAVNLTGQAGIDGSTGLVKGDGALTAISAGGSVDLTNAANAIVSATGTAGLGAFRLADTGGLNLGNVTASSTISATAATLTASGTIVAPTVALTATTGTLGLTGVVDAASAAILSGQAGIAGATGRVIGGGTLTADSAGGGVDLSNTSNAVSVASGSALTTFALADGIALNLGTVRAGTSAVVTAPTLATTGAIVSPTVSLTATAGPLTLGGTIDASTTVALAGQAGIAGASGRIIGGGPLTANSTAGAVDLNNVANAVASVTGSAAGTFAFANGAAVTLGNVTSTGGNVFLRSTHTNGITFGAGATVTSVAGGMVTLRADQIANLGTVGATGVVNAGATGTFELAPNTQGEVVSLGTVLLRTLSLESLAGITANLVRIGAYTAPTAPQTSSVTTAGSIAIGGTGFDMASGVITPATLELFAVVGAGSGKVDQTAPLLSVGTLTGSAGSFTLADPGNQIASVPRLTASTGITLTAATALTLGTINTGDAAVISATILSVPGTVTAADVSLTASTGSVTGSALTGFTLVDSKGLEIGNVSAGTTASLTAPTATVQGDVIAENVTITATSGMLGVAGAVDATTLAVLTGQTVSVTGGVFGQTASITANTGRLDVSGTVDAGTLAVLSGLIVSVANTGSVIAPTTSIAASAGVLEVAGTVNATTRAELRGQSVSISGDVIAPTTSISALSGALEVTVGGTVNASTQADLRGQSVSIAGSVIAPTTSITASSGALSVGGTVNASTRADLIGLSVSIAGDIIAPTTSITASLGTLTLDGAVTASTLADLRGQSVSIGGSVIAPTTSITATAGALTVDGAVTASSQAVLRGQSVSIEGDVISPTTSITATAGVLDVGGAVDASIIAVLTGQTVSIAGSVIAPTTSITASVGTLGITGAITATSAAVLSGAAGVIGPTGTILGNGALSAISASGSVDLTNTANIIASLEGSAPGSFRVTDSVGLAILGGKSVTADTVGITAQSIANAGTVTASGAGSSTEPALRMIATGGTVSNSGLVQATSASAGNLLVSATSGIESSGTIAAAGPGTADAPSLALVTTGGSITQTAGLIAASHEAGFLSARALGGAIAFAGTLMTGISTTAPTGAMDLVAGGDITETVISAATGSVVTGLLTASAGGNIALASTAAIGNRIATLGATSAGNVTLANARDLTIAGPVTADGGSVRIDVRGGEGTAGNLTNNGAITAASGSIRLTADGSIDNNTGAIISVGGNKSTAVRTIELIASGGTIGVASGSSIGATSPTLSSITLSAGAGITTAGTIIAGTAVRMTAAAGSIDNNTGGMITAFGAGSADAPSITLIALGGTIGNAAGATISAPMISGNISLQAGFGITTAGTITAGGSGAPAIAMSTGGMLAQSGGLIAATNAAGSATLNAGSIDIAGRLTVGSAGTLALTATGAISEGGGTGTIIAGRLTGSSGGTTRLDNLANQIGALGPFSAGSELTLLNSVEAMTVSGSITVSGENSTLFLRNGSSGGGSDLLLADDSRLQATNVTLLAPDRINGPDTTIVATALTLPNAGAAVTAANQIILGDPTSANPIPTNSIGRLGPIVANQSLVVMNATELLLGGDIAAPTIRIGATNGLTIANNVTITTGGTVLALPAQSSVPPDTDASVGFNLALLDSNGTIDLGSRLTIQGLPGVAEPTMRIAQTQGGQVRFGELVAPNTSVILHVGTGSAVSQGGGNIDVKNLFVFYRSGAPSIQLSGNVGGQSASGAATISRIGRETVTAAFGQTELGLIFDPSSVYQINQCSITSVNCVLTSTLQIPPQLPLQTLYLPLPPSVLDDPDLLLPFISDQDD